MLFDEVYDPLLPVTLMVPLLVVVVPGLKVTLATFSVPSLVKAGQPLKLVTEALNVTIALGPI
jgi:hypothetical protein